ncbi:gamma-glutamyl-gamma-aminobutyrate hydrolase family protein [Kitasatospora sp. LaBMicrA B282]|uniref:gamma-glutamyl-gamma-aminobutyrate hydrolase family protein n=1 Tax=Kitasatospora sp. LaBMicrA B282 TaxID=3420949 RepID=UPI003D149047
MTRPVVAMMADTAVLNYTIWRDQPITYLPSAYFEKVVDAGGSPVLVAPEPAAVEAIVGRVDALLLSGGQDIAPARYGAEPGPHTLPVSAARDETELLALAVAERRGIPILGICRGLQLLSISRGGTLFEHLPEHSPAIPGQYDPQKIRIEAGSVLGTAMGTSATVHCHHHQGIDKLGAGLVASAWAEDGVVEAAEDPTARFVVGLQAHAELGEDTVPLFRAFVNAARG